MEETIMENNGNINVDEILLYEAIEKIKLWGETEIKDRKGKKIKLKIKTDEKRGDSWRIILKKWKF